VCASTFANFNSVKYCTLFYLSLLGSGNVLIKGESVGRKESGQREWEGDGQGRGWGEGGESGRGGGRERVGRGRRE
jgi:hypothetical protein